MGDSRNGRISVIVPIRNKAPLLERCLGSIVVAAQGAGNTELIFLDNHSTDGSGSILARQFAGLARIVESSASNAAGVRNQGVRLSEGQLLSFLDADCEVPQDYFHQLRQVFVHDWVSATGCAVDLPTDRSWIEREWYRLHHRDTGGFRPYLNSGNFAVRREPFLQVGGFDESLETGEDSNLGERLNRAGYSIIESRSLHVLHLDNPTTIPAFFRKEVWHAKGMFGSVGFGHIDKPLVLTAAHMALGLGGIGLIVAGAAGPALGPLVAGLLMITIVPLLSVAYRHVLARQPGSIAAGLLLYQVYFLARCAALVQILLARVRKAARSRR